VDRKPWTLQFKPSTRRPMVRLSRMPKSAERPDRATINGYRALSEPSSVATALQSRF
jgi:hypothetical protein